MLLIVKLFLFCLAAWNKQWFIFSTYCKYDCTFLPDFYCFICLMFYSSTTKSAISTKILTYLKEKAFLPTFCVGNKIKLPFMMNKTKKVHLKIWGGKIVKEYKVFILSWQLWNGSHSEFSTITCWINSAKYC